MIRKLGLHLSPWVEWMEAQTVANQTRHPEDIARALVAFRAAVKFKREMPESERYVTYEIVNT